MSIFNKNACLHYAEGEHCEHVGRQHRGRYTTFDWLGRVHRSELSAAFAQGEPEKLSTSYFFGNTVPYVEGQSDKSQYFFSKFSELKVVPTVLMLAKFASLF